MGWHQEGLLKEVPSELRPKELTEKCLQGTGGEEWFRGSICRWRARGAQAQARKTRDWSGGGHFPCERLSLWAIANACWLQSSERQSPTSPPAFHGQAAGPLSQGFRPLRAGNSWSGEGTYTGSEGSKLGRGRTLGIVGVLNVRVDLCLVWLSE